jgi:hypothetical protein
MLGIPLRYMLKHPLTATADLVADRFEILTTIPDAYIAERECALSVRTSTTPIGNSAFTRTSVFHGRVK